MKLEYESPVLEVFSFEAKENVMDSGPCNAYDGAVCPVDGVCYVDNGTCILYGMDVSGM